LDADCAEASECRELIENVRYSCEFLHLTHRRLLPFYRSCFMALDLNAVKLMLWARNLGVAFERTLTLGRQGLSCSPAELRRSLLDFGFEASSDQIQRIFDRPARTNLFSEEFLRFLGAKEIVSVDLSDYEGATLMHDLNEPFPASCRHAFSFVLDSGTLEHIFDYPAALRHTLELVRPRGHFLTVTPANNLIGHGFYQLSPELFFRVLNADNGFALRKMVLFDCLKTDAPFYQVLDPAESGGRTNLRSKTPLYLAALAERTATTPILTRSPQQSDYVQAWERHRQTGNGDRTVESGALARLRRRLNPYWPVWLKRLKLSLVYARLYGPPTLRNRRHFRRLSRSDICRERAFPTVEPSK
jgi:hypothetical protein